jgi:hypothetical protein
MPLLLLSVVPGCSAPQRQRAIILRKRSVPTVGANAGSGAVQGGNTAISQIGGKVVVFGLLVETVCLQVAGVAIGAGGIEKSVADRNLIVGFPLGDVERVRGTDASRVVIMAVSRDGWHVPDCRSTPRLLADG